MAGTVAIVGRPNVGKSALFNRLIGRRLAIVDSVAGITRDRLGAEAEWHGVRFTLTDTGGIVPDPREPLVEQVRLQAEVAIAESDVLLFVCDAMDGITPLDEEVAALLRPAAARVVCVANKCDNERLTGMRHEFARFGFSDVYGVSALHGLRIDVLLDEIVRRLPAAAEAPVQERAVRVAIVGKPNVGKSSFVNALLQTNRLVVDSTPGTTRDAVDVAYTGPHGERFVLVDTAGIKRKKSTTVAVDKYSALRSQEAVARCDVAMLMIDASAGLTSTDAKIAHLIDTHRKGCVIVVNKWDLVDDMKQKDYTRDLLERLPFLAHCPVLYTVAITATNVGRALGRARKVFEGGAVTLGTGRVNDIIVKALQAHQPPIARNRRLKVYYATQTRGNPPTFLLFVNDPKLAKADYLAYLVNRVRKVEPYEGNPVVLRLRQR
ncbi:MAG: ribosome biogenesis GTPase Der [Verrucomicrobia bacterium]|nr:ribosome biogenesis GTPase Der [Verrucomicrobiota bacterium]